MAILSVYWNKMCELKYEIIYLEQYYKRNVITDRIIKIITAVASAAAIALWTKWNYFGYIWGTIIVLSQLISAVTSVLPYQKRISSLESIILQLSLLYSDMERKYNLIDERTYDEEEINSTIYDIDKKVELIERGFLNGDILINNNRYKKMAEKQMEEYFDSLYGPEEYFDE